MAEVPVVPDIPVVPDVPGTDVPGVDVPGAGDVIEVLDIDEFLGLLGELIGSPEPVPNFLEVPFSEYSVTDGLLLLLLLFAFLAALWHFIKGVF